MSAHLTLSLLLNSSADSAFSHQMGGTFGLLKGAYDALGFLFQLFTRMIKPATAVAIQMTLMMLGRLTDILLGFISSLLFSSHP